jgi:Na+-transporting methylmalonyl-CoA/oxaloacetate decarboxylase gamma subunit
MNAVVEWAKRGWGQVVEHGLGTAVGGMLVVFAALSLITLFISILPRVLHFIAPLPDDDEAEPASARKPAAPADDELLVAIGFALHTELERRSR